MNPTNTNSTIVVARGDGIGPEITDAVLAVFEHAKVPLNYEFVELGESIYRKGVSAGIAPEVLDLVRKHGVLLKGPITTPQGKGIKSVNVTLRKSLGLFANVRPCKSYVPFVPSHFPKMNIVIIRENEEDLYAGIEHRQTNEVIQTLKLLSVPGTEHVIRYAFEYAKAYGRKKVTCMTKDNIMKLTDGMFHRIFREVATEYPGITADHMIIDIGAARIAARPESFDVIVTLNLYGDIISDIAAEVAGSVGLAGSANIGRAASMFEAIHGSAPDIAGQGIANPSGLLLAGIQMLVHLGISDKAELINNAWLKTLEDGIHTGDIYREGTSKQRVSTNQFVEAIAERLGQKPTSLSSVEFQSSGIQIQVREPHDGVKTLDGVDVFLDWDGLNRDPQTLGKLVQSIPEGPLSLRFISNRGLRVFPGPSPDTSRSDQWYCRFVANGDRLTYADVIGLLSALTALGLEIIKTENLYSFDGVPGYSAGHGE